MIVIGVTGSLASGKSEVTKILKKNGARLFDADQSSREAVRKGTPTYHAIVKLFGKGFLDARKQIDRKKLAAYVFSNPKELKKLTILIHPQVIFDCLGLIEKYRAKKGFLVLDVPLLFESRMGNLADFSILVAASRQKTLERTRQRGIHPVLAGKILAAQWPLLKKKKLCDFFIENNGSFKDLEKKVTGILSQIKQKGAK